MKSYFKALKKYATFKERATRSEYWTFYFVNVAVYVGIMVVAGILAAIPATKMVGGALAVVNMIYSLGTLIPTIAVASRRAHDAGKSAWFLLVPIYNLIILVSPSAPTNKWGPNPFEPTKTTTAVPPPFKAAA